jgi:hypothetical protein
MHCRNVLLSRVRSMRRFLVGAGNCGESRMVCRGSRRGVWAQVEQMASSGGRIAIVSKQ